MAVLPIGDYEISFYLANFQPFTARGISLHLNDRVQVNGKLVVGAVETLTVTAERLVQPISSVRSLIQPTLETIQEINALTSNYTAEWARSGGGVVNVVTKSGTTEFSGSAYHFLRNDALNANSFFRNMNPRPEINGTPSRLRYNNFGYTAGGPAWPDRRKLFFFFSQEWRRSSRDRRNQSAGVPDPAWLTDPGNPNYVPPADRDANAVRLLPLWPSPNVPGTNLYRTTTTQRLDTRQEFVRVDSGVNAGWSVTGRYYRDLIEARGEYVTLPEVQPGHSQMVGHVAVLELRNVSAAFSNELSLQMSGREQTQKDVRHTRSGLEVLIPEMFPENAADLVPSIFVSGIIPITTRQPSEAKYLNQTLSDSLTLQHGSHTIKTGMLLAVEQQNSNSLPAETDGTFSFQSGGGFTAFQNFLRGNAGGACGQSCSYYEMSTDVTNRFRFRRYEAYAQDTWRIHSQVTLDLGLRYALYPPITDKENLLLDVNTSCFGTRTCDPRSGFGRVTSTRAPREIQLGIKLTW